MAEKAFKILKFKPNNTKEFGITLRKRVNEYFKTKDIDRTGDYRIWIKVIVMPLMYIVPFLFIVTNNFGGSMLTFYGLWLLMGLGIAGCGLSVMHDACHNSLSKNKKVNEIIGAIALGFVSGSTTNWKIQHNILHHSFTNVAGFDEDVNPKGVMRFSPQKPRKEFFKYQAYYAWFFYGLMTFLWATIKDFGQLYHFRDMGLLKSQGKTFGGQMFALIVRKIAYYAIILALPLYVLDVPWYHILGAWFSMHFLAGIILALIFQVGHITPETEFPIPDEKDQVDGDFAFHQLVTTANFAPSNKILSWYVGGLNYQIEHHLFPNVSHVHLPALAKIVEQTAKEFGLPYNSEPSFLGAIVSHTKFLNHLGKVA